ncbi:hypothetical protein FKM82_029977, partial [Ascaphus truei]
MSRESQETAGAARRNPWDCSTEPLLGITALVKYFLSPYYRFRASPVNDIFCQSMPGSPSRPQSLEKLEQQKETIKTSFKTNKEEEQQATKDKISTILKPVSIGSQQQITVGTTHISKLTDEQLIKEFLSGSYCFHGVR